MLQCPLHMRLYQHDLMTAVGPTAQSPCRILIGDPTSRTPTAGAPPHTTAMRPEHLKQYHLHACNRVIATGQAALDYP